MKILTVAKWSLLALVVPALLVPDVENFLVKFDLIEQDSDTGSGIAAAIGELFFDQPFLSATLFVAAFIFGRDSTNWKTRMPAFKFWLATRTIKTTDDFAKKLDIPVLGFIPSFNQFDDTVKDPESELGFFLDDIAKEIEIASGLFSGAVLITSAHPSEGKSFTTVALATYLARQGKRVCVVDGDTRRGGLSSSLNASRLDCLESMAKGGYWRDHILTLEDQPFDFISSRKSKSQSSALINKFEELKIVNNLRDEYDIVLVDSPPLIYDDALLWTKTVSMCILAVNWPKTTARQVMNSTEKIEIAYGKKPSAVWTKFLVKSSATYYGYSYDYSYSHDPFPYKYPKIE